MANSRFLPLQEAVEAHYNEVAGGEEDNRLAINNDRLQKRAERILNKRQFPLELSRLNVPQPSIHGVSLGVSTNRENTWKKLG